MSANLALPFYSHAKNHPERLALSLRGKDFTYGDLAELSERVAGWLVDRSSDSARFVGILASRSWVAYAGVLGTCWSGAAYVPLNPGWPEQRLLRILEVTELDALVVDDWGLKALSPQVLDHSPKHILAPGTDAPGEISAQRTRIAGFDALPASDSRHSPKPLTENDLAYVMFTSGTTGIPKGVMISTGSVASFLAAMQRLYPFSSSDRVSQRHELSFDFSVLDLFITWEVGASLYVIPANQLLGPSRFIREKQLTCWFAVPSNIGFMRDMRMLSPGAFPSVRYSAFCGEPLPAASARAWQEACPNSVIDNLYGPTEATVACTSQRCYEPLVVTKERGSVAIGCPFEGMDAAIVDSSLHFLTPRKVGELCLSGTQVAKGYFKDEQKTAARFPSVDGKVYYLTGDLAYQDATGIFHHLGRIDNQIKISGYRVELEDVDAHLRELCGVDSVAAVAWPITDGSAQGIVAFVAGSGLTAAEIRQGMVHRVPQYMVPSEVRFLERLPLSSNGKTDRKALASMLSPEDAV